MLPEGQAGIRIVLDHIPALDHRLQRHLGFLHLGNHSGLALSGCCPEFHEFVTERLDVPQRLSPFQFSLT